MSKCLQKKIVKLGRRGEQINVTQTQYRRGLGAEFLAAGGYRLWMISLQPLSNFSKFFGKSSYFNPNKNRVFVYLNRNIC